MELKKEKGTNSQRSIRTLERRRGLSFTGSGETRDILTGAADVVVTDGFTGNAVLKTIEGTALAMMGLLKEASRTRHPRKTWSALIEGTPSTD